MTPAIFYFAAKVTILLYVFLWALWTPISLFWAAWVNEAKTWFTVWWGVSMIGAFMFMPFIGVFFLCAWLIQ